jgi:hypothetical protein
VSAIGSIDTDRSPTEHDDVVDIAGPRHGLAVRI